MNQAQSCYNITLMVVAMVVVIAETDSSHIGIKSLHNNIQAVTA